MTVIECFSPAYKSFLNFLEERNGVRANQRHFFSSNSDGEQRVAVPVGENEWDVYIYLKPYRIHCSIDCIRARHMADLIPKTYIEAKMPDRIKNYYYYVSYVHMTGGLFHQSTQHIGGGNRERLFLFKYNQDPAAVIAWLREHIGAMMIKRAEGIVTSLERRHIKPYKSLKALVDMFQTVGKILVRLGRRGPRLQKLAPKTWAPAPVPESDIRCQAAAWIMDVARGALPLVEQDFMSLIGLRYPGLSWSQLRAVRSDLATA